MHKEAKDKHFLKKPTYEGGPKAMKEYISRHLRYPKEALAAKVGGTVSLRYTIDHKGDVIEAKVISGIGYGCDEEAIRLVMSLKFQTPKNRGLRVLFHNTIQIHFHLPGPPPQATTMPLQVTYNYVVTPKPEPLEEKPESGGYVFSIPL
jgi:protein TonB